MIHYYNAAQRTPRIGAKYRSVSDDVFVWVRGSKEPLKPQKAFYQPRLRVWYTYGKGEPVQLPEALS